MWGDSFKRLIIFILIISILLVGCKSEEIEKTEGIEETEGIEKTVVTEGIEDVSSIDKLVEGIEYLTIDDMIIYEEEEVQLKEGVTVYVDGEVLKKSARYNPDLEGQDVDVIMFRERTLIPLRDFADALDIELAWEGMGQKQHVYMHGEDSSVKFFVNSNKFVIYDEDENFKEMYTETPSILYEGTLYVPVRFLVEVLGMTVEWEGADVKIDRRYGNE